MRSLSDYLTAVYVPSKLDLHPSSAVQLRVAINLLDRFTGRATLLTDLSPEMVTSFLRWLGDTGRSARTVNSKRASIVCIWKHAARKKLAPPFDPQDIPRRAAPKKLPTAWTADQLRSIIDNLRFGWLQTFVIVLYESGARLNAASALTWADWDNGNRLLYLQDGTSKTRLQQFVRLSPATAAKLESLRMMHSQPADTIFPCPKDRRLMWAELRRACQRAGLPHTRRDLFQKIRRTTATLTAANSSVEVASRQLGHTTQRQTLSAYIDPTMLRTVQAVDVLPPLS